MHWLASLQFGGGPPVQVPFEQRSTRGARVSVVARHRVVRVQASQDRIARVGRAQVPVVAPELRSAEADAVRAHVGNRAGVPVAARRGVREVEASAAGRARVVGAGVPVVARGRRPAPARPLKARRSAGAGIPVVARSAVPRDDGHRGRRRGRTACHRGGDLVRTRARRRRDGDHRVLLGGREAAGAGPRVAGPRDRGREETRAVPHTPGRCSRETGREGSPGP